MHVPNPLRAMPEKNSYEMMELEKIRTETALYDNPSRIYNNTHKFTAEGDFQLDEAADMYGNLETAAEHGYVRRSLKSRHIQFIALGGTVGTGLFLGIGRAFTTAGPLSLLLGYTFTSTAIYAMMHSLGEMTTWLPLPGAIPQFCARYVDGAMGFAVGWNNWYSNSLTLCAEISAAAVVIQFWNGAVDINVAAWISMIIVVVVTLNIFTVSIYGEAEFIFASIKIVTIIGLIIFAIIIDLGGGPTRDRLGFRYWKNPGAMKPYIADGNTGRFLGLFSTLVNAAYSYNGVEMVAVAAGESENPRRNIPKAVRRVFWRILFFYILGSLAIGVLIPYNERRLLDAIHNDAPGGAASPWVIAIYRASVPVLPSIVNAAILTAATSCANAYLYTGSRYLFALAQNGQAPRFLLTCSRKGIPYYCIGFSASVSLLTYMSCSSGSQAVFQWFQNLTAITGLLTWISVSVAYIRFHRALRAQGINRDTLVFKSRLQPYSAWFSLCFFVIIVFFNGFYTFPSKTKKFDRNDFITAYIGLIMYCGLYLFWKMFKRTRWVKAEEADIQTGKAALDAAEGQWPERKANNWWEKVWFFIA